MCIFSGEIQSVSGTKILVAPVYGCKLETYRKHGVDKQRKVPVGSPLQLTVYSNTVSHTPSDNATAMVLPVPLITGPNRFKFVNLQNYSDLFEDLEMMFPKMRSQTRTNSADTNSTDEIPVVQVGSYKASLVNKLRDFSKLNGVFSLDPGTAEILRKYYATGYAFVVCQLNPDVTEFTYHPFAYVHELRRDGQLFVPTRHYHDVASTGLYVQNAVHFEESQDLNEYYMHAINMEDKWISHAFRRKNPPKRASANLDWDHTIYVINANVKRNKLLGKMGSPVTPAKPECVREPYLYLNYSKLPTSLSFGKIRSCNKVEINSSFKYNCDLFI